MTENYYNKKLKYIRQWYESVLDNHFGKTNYDLTMVKKSMTEYHCYIFDIINECDTDFCISLIDSYEFTCDKLINILGVKNI